MNPPRRQKTRSRIAGMFPSSGGSGPVFNTRRTARQAIPLLCVAGLGLALTLAFTGGCSRPAALANFSCEEVALLTEAELDEEGYAGAPAIKEFDGELSPSFLNGPVLGRNAYIYVSDSGTEIPVFSDLPKPILEVDGAALPKPIFRARGGRPDLQLHIEVDTSPDFNSADVWRWPALFPYAEAEDLRTSSGSALRVFTFSSFNTDPFSREIEAPFPIVLMTTGREDGDLQRSLEIKSRLAGILGRDAGSDRDAWVARQIYTYILHSYIVGSDNYTRKPIETFAAGVGECGNLNALAQAMLEFNGIASRFVSGFNPIVRQAYPGGGHTLLEVRYKDGWGILDTFLDIFDPTVSTRDLESDALGDRIVYRIDNRRFPASTYGEHLDLKNLFRYRIYADPATRLPPQTMVQLAGQEENYGLSWNLRSGYGLTDRMVVDALPVEATIYVRARFIESACIGGWSKSCLDPDAKASEWSVSSFEIRPREMMAGYLQ